MRHKRYENVFGLGDVINAPNAKTAAAARKQAPLVAQNVLHDLVPLAVDDPDFDVVRYEYIWSVNDTVVRNVVSAAQTDVLPHDAFVAGDFVECLVTPLDDVAAGPPSSVNSSTKRRMPA